MFPLAEKHVIRECDSRVGALDCAAFVSNTDAILSLLNK
jgi:hypothetical protein